jgi:hypothetical protein
VNSCFVLPLVRLLSQMNPIHTFPYYSLKTPSNINFHQRLGLPIVSSLQVFQPKYFMHFSSLPRVLHVPLILSSMILSSYKYLVKRTSYEAPHYEVFSSLPPLPPYIQHLDSTFFHQGRGTKFQTIQKNVKIAILRSLLIMFLDRREDKQLWTEW